MYFSKLTLVFASVLAAATANPLSPTPDLGINCRGSSNCAGGDPSGHALSVLQTDITGLPAGNVFGNGAHIACDGHICCFYQNLGSGVTFTASQTANFVGDLLSHGCNTCGSVPTQPGNDVSTGELTCNWVSTP